MSKELTEKWKNRKLGGRWYYIKVLGKIEIARLSKYNQFYHLPITNGYAANKDVSEVLTPVPTYDQFVELTELVKKVDELEKEKAELLEKIEELKDESLYWEKSYLGVL